MRLARVTFANLYEVDGAFGQEWISPGGGVFPKYLIYSYDLQNKTVIFPPQQMIRSVGGSSADNYKCTEVEFNLNGIRNVLRHDLVKKLDSVEVDCDPKEFEAFVGLKVMILRVPRKNKARVDQLIQKQRTTGAIIAERSRNSRKIIERTGHGKKIFPQHMYEIVIRESAWQDFALKLRQRSLAPRTDRSAIFVTGPVFPLQLVYFNIR